MGERKYALLDTDFISKMHLIQKNDENKLIDKILEMPDYHFYCHKQIQTELKRHNIAGSPEWLDFMIENKSIVSYDDKRIILELESVYGRTAVAVYVHFLETACSAYKSDYFSKYFTEVAQVDYRTITVEKFLEILQKDCDNIGQGSNLGEIKTYVLLQWLQVLYGDNIYVFCSDDKNARKGIVSIGGATCISVLSAFLMLNQECDLTREEAEPYIQTYINLCSKVEQKTFKVQCNTPSKKIMKVPCKQVLDEIFMGKFRRLGTGDLKYTE